MIVTTPHQPDPEKYPGGRMLGLTIRGRRVGAGLTLRRCAAMMGLTMTDLSAVEQGQRPFTEQEFSDFNRVANLKPAGEQREKVDSDG